MTENIFGDYSAYYDLLYGDKQYAAESQYVAGVLSDIAPAVRTILEFGSGTGRHGRLLAGRGFEVTGVERSETMVSIARRTGPPTTHGQTGSFQCIQGDIRTVDLGAYFDAVISLFHVVSYQTTNADLRQTFANAGHHLLPGGLFFFDVWHGPAVLGERPAVRVKRAENNDIRLWRVAEPRIDLNASVVTVAYTILAESKQTHQLTTFDEEHHMRYLFPTDIDLLADQAGFRVVRSEEFLTRNPPSEQTWGVAYALRKEG